MEPDCNRLSEQILKLTLEIIYLLTGENDIVVKKTAEDGQNPVMVPLHSFLVPEKNNEQQILEVTKKITVLLTGEGGNVSTFNIRIKEEVKDGEEKNGLNKQDCIEGQKDLFKDIKVENKLPLALPDGSIIRKPPERCPRPLYPRDSTQEDLTIPHHDQEAAMGMKVTVKQEEDPYVGDKQQLVKYDEIMQELCKQNSSLGASTGGNDGWISSGGSVILSPDCKKEDAGLAQHSPGVSILTQNLHHKLNPMNCEKSFIKHELVVQQTVPTIEKPFTCSVCEKSFINKSRLVQHQRIHTGLKPCPCFVCGKCFIDKSQLNRHQKIHTGEKPYSCPDCGKRFPSKGNRDKHMRIHTDKISIQNPPERCPIPLYSQDLTKEDHTMPHHDQGEEVMGIKIVVIEEEEAYTTDDQPPTKDDEMRMSISKDDSSLDVSSGEYNGWISPEERVILAADYNKEDNGLAPYSPRGCEKSYKTHELVVHQRIPTMERPFSCSQCEKSFINKSRLIQHMRIHTGVKPFSCAVCGKSFIDKSQLNRHQIVHTGEKPYSCPDCGKCFPSKGNRDKHMRIHTGEKPFPCPECGKCFAQKVTLVLHQRKHTT